MLSSRLLRALGASLFLHAASCGDASELASRQLAAPAATRGTLAMRPCNGHVALCMRSVDEVVFPGAHNAMSHRDGGWRMPNQNHGITRQLTDGIRALLVDSHYYNVTTRRTDHALDPDVPSWQQTYFCHKSCLFGRQKLAAGLAEIRDFLLTNDREVVLVIIEDYISMADTERAFADSGLLAYVYTPALTAAWPTLEELIDADKRVIVFSEHVASGSPWYPPAWRYFRDTSFRSRHVGEFACGLNRGADTNPFLLINHWLNPASVAHATLANSEPILRSHVQSCALATGRKPNILAVDFYDVGTVLAEADRLNAMPDVEP